MIPGVAAAPKGRVPDRSWSDEELVLECVQGSEEAWAALIDKYRNLVYSVAAKYRMPPEDAADVFQSVWTDLFSELPRLRSAGALRSWLFTVAGHKCYRWKRQQDVGARSGDADLIDLSDPRISFIGWKEEIEREQMLRDAVVELPSRCREMVRLLFYEQPPRPYKEIAAQLGLAEGSIGFTRGRCLSKLRATLEKMGF